MVKACGADVYVQQQGTGKNLLLLHGWGGKCESWAHVLRDLQQDFAMTALDFPGQGGRSSDPPEPWDVSAYAEMTFQVLKELGIARTSIVAHSFGGRVSLVLAAEHPELVDKMVLTGVPGLRVPPTPKQKLRSCLYKGLKALAECGMTRKLLGEERVHSFRCRLQERFGSRDYRALSPEMRKTFSKVVSQDLSGYLERIAAPTLLFWGTKDTAAPLWMGQEMARRIPDAGLVVREAGHFAHEEWYTDFLAVLKYFLSLS
jgi:pimeloyl-ACP methyl ester carboxylesterase